MICNVALLFSRFRAAVCFCTAGFRVYTLHGLPAMEKKKKKEKHTARTCCYRLPFRLIYQYQIIEVFKQIMCIMANTGVKRTISEKGSGGKGCQENESLAEGGKK